MKWLFAVLSSLLCLALVQGEEWELVYPQQFPIAVEMPYNCIFADGDDVLIGSNTGHVIADFDPPLANERAFDLYRAEVIRLENVSFTITSISKTDIGWIVGSENGEIAIRESTASNSESAYDNFSKNWKIASGLPGEVQNIAAIDDTVLIVAGTRLVRLLDNNLNWIEISPFPNVLRVAVFKDEFYILVEVSDGNTVELHRSTDGYSWEPVWDIEGHTFDVSSLTVGLDTLDPDGASDSLRLYVSVYYAELTLSSFGTLKLSTVDGRQWLDHSSTQSHMGKFGLETRPWNPLNLDKSLLGFPADGFHGDYISGRYRIGFRGESLQFYNEADWDIFSISHTLETSRLNSAVWGEISFLQTIKWMRPKLVTIANDGSVSEASPPLESTGYSWYEWFAIAGRRFAKVSTSLGRHLFYLTDNQEWEISPGINGNILLNYSVEDGELITLENNQLFAWSDTTWSEGIAYSGQPSDFSYVKSTSTWYAISQEDNTVTVQSLKDQATLTSFTPLGTDTAFTELSSPDDEVLIAYGNTNEFAVIEINGSVKLRTIPQFIDNIESVDYVNGWFYFHGIRTFRSRNFEQFEMVSPPLGQSLVRVVGFGNDLYGFAVNGRVFKRPLDKGILDSIQMKQGWNHADWLGWFQIIDEELGDIDHLLLGNCWVKQTSKLEYWIRTEALGWIYVRKDWSPWFWRMDDAHWYWLDHDSWPGRAWDEDDKEWEELAL